jgi:hypothetical protein
LDINQRRRAWLYQFWFRIIILLISALLIYLCRVNFICNQFWNTTILGIVCSLFAWDVVACFDFIVDMNSTFLLEYYQFRKKVRCSMDIIVNKIKMETRANNLTEFENNLKKETNTNIELWKYIYNEFEKLNIYINLLPEEQKIYILSTEYERFKNYIDRCYYFLFFRIEREEISCEELYHTFVIRNQENKTLTEHELMVKVNRSNEFSKAIRDLKNTELNDNEFTLPEVIMSERLNSSLYNKSLTNMPNSKQINDTLSFLPYIRFEKLLSHKLKWYNIFFVVNPFPFRLWKR